MARGGQMFRAECKFPSFIQQQINICLAERVTVYTGVYLAIPYFICAHEGKLCRNTDVPLGPLATLGVKDVSPASRWKRRRGWGGEREVSLDPSVFHHRPRDGIPKDGFLGLEHMGLAHLSETSACEKFWNHSRTVISRASSKVPWGAGLGPRAYTEDRGLWGETHLGSILPPNLLTAHNWES